MAVLIDSQERRIGLALSGGGFRAAAFHLGVFKKLEALNLLEKVDALSCVSGGSIAGAFLATNWGQADVLVELEQYLATRSIAVSSVIGGLLDPFHSRLDKLAKSYDRHLFHNRKLKQLRNGPRIYLNATNLSTGNMFSFVAGGDKATEMGEWELGFAAADDFPISDAGRGIVRVPSGLPAAETRPRRLPDGSSGLRDADRRGCLRQPGGKPALSVAERDSLRDCQ